jgi:hypothetical protein
MHAGPNRGGSRRHGSTTARAPAERAAVLLLPDPMSPRPSHMTQSPPQAAAQRAYQTSNAQSDAARIIGGSTCCQKAGPAGSQPAAARRAAACGAARTHAATRGPKKSRSVRARPVPPSAKSATSAFSSESLPDARLWDGWGSQGPLQWRGCADTS